MPALRAHLLKRFELYVALTALAFVGLAVALVRAEVEASVAILSSVLGLAPILAAIQWADRERQGHLRARAIGEIREMLTDQVLNQLAAVRMWMAEDLDPESLAAILGEADASLERATQMINGLSEQQLDTWRLTYANVADHVAFSSIPEYTPTS